ncbi:DNA cytosine methyltransferase [Flavobacterium caeni]|uniref:DNA (cytosine-5-)-methyltransferase n=1 Tax=Flavobacterium caeni TaxID=490189 RepID=A0A1G5K3N6_9FLAO|nr:DNA cytosine methyltransferase [Flavobacterium caeni]SCY94479.1 DNA (cytosine-5)-methyltransferase 1 [Flavobacterium caeni]
MRYSTAQHSIGLATDNHCHAEDEITGGEFFAGGGGWTEGTDDIDGYVTKWILNHDKVACRTNAFHHNVKVYWSDIYTQDEHELEPVDHCHASLECNQHSGANACEEKKLGSYTQGWELYRYLPHLNPLVLSIENVPEFKKWAPTDEKGRPIKSRVGEEFERWKKAIMDLGYNYKESIRNAADDGLPTRRKRYFAFFYRDGIDIEFPEFTHSKTGTDGKLKWLPCAPHIDTDNHGTSIFGREFNENLPKHLRKPIAKNSQRRIGGGVVKYAPEVEGLSQFIAHFHGGENQNRFQSLLDPINTIDTSNRHQLVTVEKLQFIMDHCRTTNYHKPDTPLKPQLTWQTKQLITIDNFICQFYGGSDQTQPLSAPLNTCTTRDRHQLIRLEKLQFLTQYFNSNGNPQHNVQSLDEPLSPVLTEFKHQLVTILDNFDIKTRFLNREELASCSTFPRDYFSHPDLKLSNKDAVKMIGNAVPPKWAKILMTPNIPKIKEYKYKLKSA